MIVQSASEGETLLTFENIQQLADLEQFLQTNYGLGMIQSPITLLKTLNQSVHGGHQRYYAIPDQPRAFDDLMTQVKRYHLLEPYNHIIGAAGHTVSVSGRVLDAGRRYYETKNELFRAYLKEQEVDLDVQLTGVAYLIDNANAQVTVAFTMGLGVVLFICLIIIGLQTASIRMTLLALIVNLVPLLFAAAWMGTMGIPLKISTALLFTLVLGISVDDTIHFLHRYLDFRTIYPNKVAIKLTIRTMIQPVFFTSTVLFAGFMIFSLSSFESIRVLGWVTGLSILMAMLTDIMLLPLLLLKTENRWRISRK
jgi:hypothetical protein